MASFTSTEASRRLVLTTPALCYQYDISKVMLFFSPLAVDAQIVEKATLCSIAQQQPKNIQLVQ